MSQHPRPTFTWLGHATVRCDLPGGEVVLIDPWVAQNPSCPKEHKSFDRLDVYLKELQKKEKRDGRSGEK